MGFWGTVPRGEHQVIVNQLETSENQKKLERIGLESMFRGSLRILHS